MKQTTIEAVAKFKEVLKEGDEEDWHQVYDDLITKRLKDLDPEFVGAMEKVKGFIGFWYA